MVNLDPKSELTKENVEWKPHTTWDRTGSFCGSKKWGQVAARHFYRPDIGCLGGGTSSNVSTV